MTRSKAKPLEAVPNIAPPPIAPLVRSIVDGEELVEVTSFLAGRVRCVLDHNGNAEVTMRVPAADMGLVIPMMRYPGVELRVTVAVPAGAIE